MRSPTPGVTERWDSLRLLTPNWLNRLPGYRYEGDDPDGYMTMPEIVDYIATYADTIDAPVESHTEVTSVETADDGFRILTTDGEWRAKAVVIASGPYHRPDVPAFAGAIPPTVRCLAAADYRNPDQLERRWCHGRGSRVDRCPAGRRDPPIRSPRHPGRRWARPDAPACTGAWTSCGGSTPPASSTNATTRWMTSSAPVMCPRSSWWAPRPG